MALFGSLSTVRAQLVPHSSFDAAFRYLEACFTAGSPERTRIFGLAEGKSDRVDLGGGVFALEQVYHTKPRDQGKWESHLAYIDIQVIFAGEEFMEVVDVAALTVTENLTPTKDLLFYAPFHHGSVLRTGAGAVAVFFPVDGHRPSLSTETPSLIRKTVVKVPVLT